MTDLQSIPSHLPGALLVVTRIGGLMLFGPIIGSPLIPMQVKALLAVALGLCAYPVVGGMANPEQSLNLWMLGPLFLVEALIGILIGYVASLPLIALEGAGLIAGQQMGLGFAHVINPATEDDSDVISQALFFLSVSIFLVIGGHESMLLAVYDSFAAVPAGSGGFAEQSIVGLATGVLASGLEFTVRVSAPLLALITLETIALGFLARTVPQLNVLSLGFPLRILLGLALLSTSLYVTQDVLIDQIMVTHDAVAQWIMNCRIEHTEGLR